jgi:hypothetical protein
MADFIPPALTQAGSTYSIDSGANFENPSAYQMTKAFCCSLAASLITLDVELGPDQFEQPF